MKFHESQSLSSLKLLFFYRRILPNFPAVSCPRLKMLLQMLPLLDDPWRLHWRQLWRTVAVEWCCGCYLVYLVVYFHRVFILILIYHPPWNFPHGGWWCFTFHCYRKGYSQLTDWICHRGRWMTTKVVCKILSFKTLTQCLRFNAEGNGTNGKSKNLKVAMILYYTVASEKSWVSSKNEVRSQDHDGRS